MNTQKIKKYLNSLMLISLLGLGLMQVACGKKNDGNPPTLPSSPSNPFQWGWGPGASCAGGNPLLQTLIGKSPDQSLQMEVSLYGQQISGFCNQPPEKRFICAMGAGALAGRVRVSGYTCMGLPPGEYSLCPQNPGQLQSGTLAGGSYSLQGPGGVFQLLLHQGIVTNRYSPYGVADGQPNGIFAIFVVANLPSCTLTFSPQ